MTAPNTDTPAVVLPTEETLARMAEATIKHGAEPNSAIMSQMRAAYYAAAPAPDPSSLQKMQTAPDDLAMREAVAREICDAILDQEMDGRVELGDDLTIRYLDQGAVDFGQVADRVLSLLRSTVETGNQGGAT